MSSSSSSSSSKTANNKCRELTMKRIKEFVLIISIIIQSSNCRCPKATFEFQNQTTWASYNFIDSSIGNIGSLETCPYTGRPYVYLPCYPNSSWGNEPYFSSCFKPVDPTVKIRLSENPLRNYSIEDIETFPLTTSNDVRNILAYLNDDTKRYESASNVAAVVNVMDRIVRYNQHTDDLPLSFYPLADKIFSLESTREAQEKNQSFVKLLSSLERYSQNMIIDELDKSFIQSNLIVSIVNQPNNRTKPVIGFAYDSVKNELKGTNSVDHNSNSTFIILDPQAIHQQNRLACSIYNQKHGLFNHEHYRVLSPIISLTIDKPDFMQTVKMNFHLTDHQRDNNSNLICAYWKIFANLTAQWSTDGCVKVNMTNTSVTCRCNHLTHFAVLMDIEQKSTPKLVEQVLSIITLIGLFLSSVGLCLTILTFILFKKLRRHFSQKSLLFLSINLLCVNILFSMICLMTLKHMLCILIASLLHYFILASFSWMFIMALIQYLLFVKVFPHTITAFTRKAAAFAQLVPLIPVTMVLIFDPWNYTKRTDQICWLSNLPFYLSFLLPIVLYILINSIIFSIVTYSLLCGKASARLRSSQITESQRLSRFSVTLSCFIVLGLTWIFGLLAIGFMRILFQILFCLFATLTGLLIFILYILTSKIKRTCWNNAFKSLGISSIYSPALSSSSGFLGSKEYSTTSISDPQRLSSRHSQFSIQPQHFIDAYMPSSPPPPAPPILQSTQPPLHMESDDSLSRTNMVNQLYEPRHVWSPQTNYIYETNQPTTSLDDYSLFYASHHDATKL